MSSANDTGGNAGLRAFRRKPATRSYLGTVEPSRVPVTAAELAAELGCEVTPHPLLKGVVEARSPVPGVWVLVGTPGEILAEVRKLRAA